MNIPTLPTDSLYKFAALGSLAAWVFIVVFGWSQFTQIQQLLHENQEQVAVLRVELDIAKQKQGFVSDEAALEVKKNVARSTAKLERINSLFTQSRWLSLLSLIASAFCLFICLRSFHQWYVRVQQPQDRLLQLQVQKAIKEAERADAT